MGALRQEKNIITFERKLEIMSNNGTSRSDKIKEFINTTGGFLAFIAIIGAAIFYVVATLTRYGFQIDGLNEKFGDFEESYKEMNEQMQSSKELSEEDHEILIELAANIKEEVAYNVELLNSSFARTETIDNEVFLSKPNLENSYAIAKDWNGDTTYKVSDFYNTPIITSYKEGGNDVYFYGMYNENGNWSGTCILNTYNGDNLVSIFEGVYEDGNLYRYRRVVDEGDGAWLVTDRIRQDDYNIGETWRYTKQSEFVKDFTKETVKEKQISNVSNFLASRKERLMGYYNGRTSGGRYNDDTGDAYLVKYKDDGDVEFLYVGKFKNGYPDDNTGDAWSIGWGHANDGYHYFKGAFYNNDHKETKESMKVITKEEIKEKVNPKMFKCPLTGLIDETS